MTTRQFNDIITDPDGRSIYYFNSRIISAEDMTTQQDFNREEQSAITQALGEGIAQGLTVSIVSKKPPILHISAGLAINRSGATLRLPTDIDLALSPVVPSTPTDGATFTECGNLTDTDAYLNKQALYLLTMYPVETREGRAQTSGLNNAIAPCNNKYRMKGVRFRRIQIPTAGLDMKTIDRLRNQLAYACFGVETYQNPLTRMINSTLSAYGVLDGLRPNVLTNCDVPLAVLYMTSDGGLVFSDMWSVRRRMTAPSAYGWSALNDRRVAESEAMLMQFNDHINDLLRDTPAIATVQYKASTYFRYLPPAGLLPISKMPSQKGLSEANFFSGITTRGVLDMTNTTPFVIEGALLETVLRDSYSYPPIDLDPDNEQDKKKLVWVYHIRESMQVEASTGLSYVLFTTGHMPYLGNGRYNVNYWNYSNFFNPDLGG